MFRVDLATNAYCGVGAAGALPKALKELDFARIGIVVDKAVADFAPTVRLLQALRSEGLMVATCFRIDCSTEPTYDYLDEVANRFRSCDCDAIVGIGGGSALDIAKGVAILKTNPGRGVDYRGTDKVRKAGLPVALVPSTAGSGSEVTSTASFIDSTSMTKLGINGRHVQCLISALDPSFVSTCPRLPTIAGALDAIVHGLEACTSTQATPVSTLLGSEAIRLVFRSLPRCVSDPADLSAWTDALLAAHYAGLAMCNAGGGPASGVSYPLGVHYSVPHGLAGGILLSHVVQMNVAAGYSEAYAAIYDHIVGNDRAASAQEKAARFSALLFELYEQVDAPKNFGGYGLTSSDIPGLIALTMEQRAFSLRCNPVDFGEKDVRSLLELVIDDGQGAANAGL